MQFAKVLPQLFGGHDRGATGQLATRELCHHLVDVRWRRQQATDKLRLQLTTDDVEQFRFSNADITEHVEIVFLAEHLIGGRLDEAVHRLVRHGDSLPLRLVLQHREGHHRTDTQVAEVRRVATLADFLHRRPQELVRLLATDLQLTDFLIRQAAEDGSNGSLGSGVCRGDQCHATTHHQTDRAEHHRMPARITDDRHPPGAQHGDEQGRPVGAEIARSADHVIEEKGEDRQDGQHDHPLPLVATDRSQKLHRHEKASFTRTSVVASVSTAGRLSPLCRQRLTDRRTIPYWNSPHSRPHCSFAD